MQKRFDRICAQNNGRRNPDDGGTRRMIIKQLCKLPNKEMHKKFDRMCEESLTADETRIEKCLIECRFLSEMTTAAHLVQYE